MAAGVHPAVNSPCVQFTLRSLRCRAGITREIEGGRRAAAHNGLLLIATVSAQPVVEARNEGRNEVPHSRSGGVKSMNLPQGPIEESDTKSLVLASAIGIR